LTKEDDMRSTDGWTAVRRLAAAAAIIGVAGIGVAADGRLDRKVQVMERVIDEVLVQSGHVTVSSRQPTRGLVLDDYGVVFSFEGRLGSDGWFGPGVGLVFGDGDARPGVWTVPENMEDLQKDLKEKQQEAEQRRAEDRRALQDELVDALLDYGATLSELAPDDRVVIAAYLESSFPLGREEEREQIVLTARYGDLQRALVGDLSRQEAAALVRVTTR
jgi:hypothetical protein